MGVSSRTTDELAVAHEALRVADKAVSQLEQTTNDMHGLVPEAQDTARRAIEFSKQVARLLQVRTEERDRAITVAERSQEQVEKLLTLAENRDNKYLEVRSTLGRLLLDREHRFDADRPLDPDELEAFSQLLPQWRIKVEIAGGEVRKVFSRQIIPYELEKDRLDTEGFEGPKVNETYRRFCDPEHFDYQLAEFFGAFSGSGDSYGNGQYRFSITPPTQDLVPAITWADFSATVQAETYLQTKYFRNAEEAGATVELS